MKPEFLLLSLAVPQLLLAVGCAETAVDEAVGYCTPGQRMCDGSDVIKCMADGSDWSFFKECSHGCKGGDCLAAPCVAKCDGRECGDDGCGGICGHCYSIEGALMDGLCQADGQCGTNCLASCAGKECGTDGCGGSCGHCFTLEGAVDDKLCLANGTCSEGCVPVCEGKECGSDGCGGVCGHCYSRQGAVDDSLCTVDGTCATLCEPNCKSKQCGADGCGGICGHCYASNGAVDDSLCGPTGKCKTQCVPDCIGVDCGSDGCGGQCGQCPTGKECQDGQCISTVTIIIDDCVIGPGKADGKQWDGWGGTVPSDVQQQVQSFVDSGMWMALISYLKSVAMESLEKPDPFGWAELSLGGAYGNKKWLADYDTNTEDTFTPIWKGGPGWSGISLTQATKVRVTLLDEDLSNDDDIGVAVVNYDDLMSVWAEGKKTYVPVAGQTNNQLLLIGMEVY
jgi:hypothetical protein